MDEEYRFQSAKLGNLSVKWANIKQNDFCWCIYHCNYWWKS